MKMTDIFYGTFEMPEVIEAICRSRPVERMKNIHQGGAIFLVNPAIDHSRYEHSVGVMLLIKKLGGDLTEQIAGLLHDISHTAFSHVADYVFENKAEDYHDSLFQASLLHSEIPELLQIYGLNHEVLTGRSFTLLEQELPALCADRIDYTLRDLYKEGLLTLHEIHEFVNDLTVFQERIVLSSVEKAKWFAQQYIRLNNEYFNKPEYRYANHLLAEILREAIKARVISEKDLMCTDTELLQILRNADHPGIDTRLARLESRKNHELVSRDVFKKRTIDPEILIDGRTIRLSEFGASGS